MHRLIGFFFYSIEKAKIELKIDLFDGYSVTYNIISTTIVIRIAVVINTIIIITPFAFWNFVNGIFVGRIQLI